MKMGLIPESLSRDRHKLAGQKTVLLISHRLANVVNADKIYVISQGMVAESGTHKELMDKAGVYRNLYMHQQELESYKSTGKGEMA